MANVIVTGGEATKHKIMQIFPKESLGALVIGITEAIALSFEKRAMRNPTMEEKRRRFEILMRNILVLRGDHKWGVQRIVDAMPDILMTELDGGKYKPDEKRTTWVPSDGS